MSDIVGTAFYEQMVDMFAAQGSSSRFKRDYLKALTLTLNQIGIEANFDSQPTPPTDTDEIDLDVTYENALFWGVVMYLIVLGQSAGPVEYKDAFDHYELAKSDVAMYQAHELQEDRDDDETDIVGLGYQE